MLHEVVRALTSQAFPVKVSVTTPEPDSARTLALRASRTCDLVLACSGDGTVHGVLQGIAGTPAVLGVLPFGTANALARNLRLPLNPVLALAKLLSFKPCLIPLGHAESSTGERWFTVMAGAGPDGALVREMELGTKARLGRRAYYAEAARLFLSRRFPVFQVEYRLRGSSIWNTQAVVALMASRVADLGGLFSGLTRGAHPHQDHLTVQLLRAPAHLSLPAWVTFGKLGWEKANPYLIRLEVEELRCTPLQETNLVYAQVDGEAFGPLPLGLTVVPEAVRLLMPDEY